MPASTIFRNLLPVTLLLLYNFTGAQVLFTWTVPESYCAPTQILFSDLTSPRPVSWQWAVSGPENMNSSNENPAFSFTVPGDYMVCLSVNGNPTPVYCEDFTIYAPPNASFIVDPGYSANGTEPHTVCFLNTSTEGSGQITSVTWDLGVPPLNDNYNACVTYPEGEYEVSMQIIDENGCIDDIFSAPGFIEVTGFSGIQAFFEVEVDSSSACSLPLTIHCMDQSSGMVDEWEWLLSGPQNGASTDQNTSFVITTPGMYTLSLTANGADSYSVDIDLTLPLEGPVVDFSADGVSSCNVPFHVQFASVSPDAYRYHWEIFPETIVGTGNWQENANPQITFLNPGAYDVTLTVSDITGCTTSVARQDYISIDDSISVSIVTDAPGNATCFGDSICFEVLIGDLPPEILVSDIEWELPFTQDPLTSGTRVCTRYLDDGRFPATATVTFSGGCPSATVTDTIETGLRPSLTASLEPDMVCLNECLTGTAVSSLHNTRFDWYFEAPGGYVNGGIGTSSAVGYCYTDEWQQPFGVLLIAGEDVCRDTVELEAFVNPPGAQFEWQAGCFPSTEVSFTVNQDLGVFSDSGFWYVDGQTGAPIHAFTDIDDAAFTHDFGTQGSYMVQLVVHSSFTGCTDSVSQLVEVPGLGIGNLVADPREANCPPLTVNFTPAIPGFADTITWYPGNGDGPFVSVPPHMFSYTYMGYPEDDWYDVSMTYRNGDCLDSLYKQNYIRLSPASGAFGFTPDSGAAPLQVELAVEDLQWTDSILWNFGQGDSLQTVSAITDLMMLYTEPGIYMPFVQLLAEGCPPVLLEAGLLTVFTVSGVSNKLSGKLSVHPNPVSANSTLQWNLDAVVRVREAVVYGLSGKVILYQTDLTEAALKIGDIPAGQYVILLKTDRGAAARLFQVVSQE